MAGITKISDLHGIPSHLKEFLQQFLYGTVAGAPTAASTGVNATGKGTANTGAMLLDRTNGVIYKNTGTKALPVWNAVGTIAAGEITLAEGNVLVGNSSGVGVALDIGNTSAGIAIGNGTTATVAALSGDVTMSTGGVVTIGAAKIDEAMMNDNSVVEQSMLIDLPVTIPITAVLGNRAGTNSDGVMVGGITHTAIADVTSEDNSGASFVDDTADAASAGAGDVAIGPDPFDNLDALYMGHGTIFSAVVVKVGTAGAGDATAAETDFEYWNGAAWASLTEVTDTSVEFTAGTSTYVISFLPPSDWAATTVDGGSSLFYIRFISSANDVYNTTQPLLTQLWCLPLATGQGPQMPFDCTVTAIEGTAVTASATNDDTEILLVNVTAGTFAQFTWTGGDIVDATASLTLAFTAGDQYAVQILQEDGTTEFDGVTLQAICSVG